MIPLLRPATEEEANKIKERSDLTSTTSVLAWPNEDAADIAVVRECVETDPIFFAEGSGKQRKMMFFWVLANILKGRGHKELYFNIDAEGSEDYQAVLDKLGASKLTEKPQFRYKLAL